MNNIDFINLFRFGAEEDLKEYLKDFSFEKIEDINGYKTFEAKKGNRTFQAMIFPWDKENVALSYNGFMYRSIKI